MLTWAFIVDLFCFITWSVVPRGFLFQFCVILCSASCLFKSIITGRDYSLPSDSICITLCLFSALMPRSPFCSLLFQLSVSIHVSNSLCITLMLYISFISHLVPLLLGRFRELHSCLPLYLLVHFNSVLYYLIFVSIFLSVNIVLSPSLRFV